MTALAYSLEKASFAIRVAVTTLFGDPLCKGMEVFMKNFIDKSFHVKLTTVMIPLDFGEIW